MSRYFRSLMRQLHHNIPQYQHYTNLPRRNIRQSSVAIIFRVNKPQSHFQPFRREIQSYYSPDPDKANFNSIASIDLLERVLEGISDEDLHVLLTERTTSQRDINSGYIVFPGGKCEEKETDLTACLRETKEEVGLRLIDQSKGPFEEYLNCYLGKSLSNLFYQKYKGSDLYVTAHVFLLLHNHPLLVLNAQQVCQAQWIPFCNMLNPNKLSRQQNHNQSAVIHAIPKILFFRRSSICQHIDYAEYSVLDVNFKRMHMWGCTMYLWLYVCEMIRHRMRVEGEREGKIGEFVQKADMYRVKFRRGYLPGVVFRKAAEHWHYKHRSLACRYPGKEGNRKVLTGGLVCVLAVSAYYLI